MRLALLKSRHRCRCLHPTRPGITPKRVWLRKLLETCYDYEQAGVTGQRILSWLTRLARLSPACANGIIQQAQKGVNMGLALDEEAMQLVDSIRSHQYNAAVARIDSTSTRRTIGSVLRELRELGGATLEEVAEHVDVHWATLSKIEKGERPYRDGLLEKYSAAVREIAKEHAVKAILAALALAVDIKDVLSAVDTRLKQQAQDEAKGEEPKPQDSANTT